MTSKSVNDTDSKSQPQSDALSQHSSSSSPHDAAPDQQIKTKSGEAPVEPQLERNQAITPGEQYSVFTVGQKRAIVLAGSFAAFFSPMTGSIYFPALTTIADDLNVSASSINLTVTTYLIWQGVAPMLIAGFSDKIGRRPPYIMCFTIYSIANLALALQNSYVALLLLRMLQSAGSSGTVALAQGMVGDIITSAERGQYVAYASLATMLGPSLSPIIGGLIASNLNWHWIFWFLFIFALVVAVPFLLFLPETGRQVVDDGSIPPPPFNANITDYIRHKHRRAKGLEPDEQKTLRARANYKLRWPNPLPTLLICLDLESGILLLTTGLCLACFYAISTGASKSFSVVYGFSDIQVGLMFIPIGAGGILSAFTTGRIIDWNFRRHCKIEGVTIQKGVRQDLSDFPIERARLEISLLFFWIGMAGVIGYGWVLNSDKKISLAAPVIMLFLMGYALIAANQGLNVLMVDIWPGKAASATAANNLFRCLLGAAASAAIEPMSSALGKGWAYTTLALISVAVSPTLVVTMRYGIEWRRKRSEKERRAEERKKEKRLRKEQAKKVEQHV